MGVMPDVRESSWDAADVVSRFAASTGFTDPGEAAALRAVAEWAGGDVLDIGVGGGRTTGLLASSARSYVGVDLSSVMLDVARRRHPDVDLRLGDAADLAGLPDAAYDLVVFSFNGLDALDHAGRGAALQAMARVARPDGRVLFSSLNLDGVSYDERPWRVAGGVLGPRFRHHLRYAASHPSSVRRSLHNYRRTRQESEDGVGWGRRPLREHEFRFVVHFATMEETVAEARAAGLEVVAAYADDGREPEPCCAHTDADYVHFVCRRI